MSPHHDDQQQPPSPPMSPSWNLSIDSLSTFNWTHHLHLLTDIEGEECSSNLSTIMLQDCLSGLRSLNECLVRDLLIRLKNLRPVVIPTSLKPSYSESFREILKDLFRNLLRSLKEHPSKVLVISLSELSSGDILVSLDELPNLFLINLEELPSGDHRIRLKEFSFGDLLISFLSFQIDLISLEEEFAFGDLLISLEEPPAQYFLEELPPEKCISPKELFSQITLGPIPVCMIEDKMTQSLRCMIARTAECALALVPETGKHDRYRCTLTTNSSEFQRSEFAYLVYVFSLDDGGEADDPAGLHVDPSSSSSSLPLRIPNVQFYNHKDSSSCLGANMDQCCNIRGTLILPVFDRYRGISVGVLELVTTSPNISYAYEVEVIQSSTNEQLDSRIDCFQSHQGLEIGRDVLLEFGDQFEEERKVIQHAGQSCHNAVAFSETKGTGTGESLKITHRKKGETITLEMVQQHFNQSLLEAARSLKVSKSTLKRHCRKLGIARWPSQMMMSEGRVPSGKSVQNAGSYLTNASRLPSTPAVVSSDQLISKFREEKYRSTGHQQQNFKSSSTAIASDPTTDQFTPALPCVVSSRQDNLGSVMTTVKATYGDLTIRFQIDSTAGSITDQLKDGIAKRLHLQDGSYNMEYKDDADELILINCDEDVQECIRILGSKEVKLCLRDKSSRSKRGVKRRNITCDLPRKKHHF